MRNLRKLAGVFEVLGVIAIGWTLTRMLLAALGVPDLQKYLDEVIRSSNPAYFDISGIAFITLAIQFFCLIIPAYLLNKVIRKWGFKELGLTKGNRSIKDKLRLGIALFCIFGILMKGLLLINHFIDLGEQPSYWAIFEKKWNFGFWVFMAVGSYAVIPIFEEIFYRGYCQRRLEKEFGFFAVIFTSFLFAAVHLQYYILDVFNVGMLLSLLFLSFSMCVSVYVTRSVIPAIVIHSLMNIPVFYPYDLFLVIVMLILALVLRETIREVLSTFSKEINTENLIQNSSYLIAIVLFALGMSYLPGITIISFALLFLVSLIIQIKKDSFNGVIKENQR